MKLSTLLLAVESALSTRVAALGGTVEMFITPADALRKLGATPAQWRVLIGWGGGQNTTHYGGVDKTRLQVIVQAARGLSFDPAADALRGTTTEDALLDRIEAVQGLVRGLRFYADQALTTFHAQLESSKGFLAVSTEWIGAADSLPDTRDALLTFVIERAIPPCEEIKVYLPTS